MRSLKDFYTEQWGRTHAKSPSTKVRSAYILSLIKKLGVKSIIDVGCGSGHLANCLTRAGYIAYGLDIVESNINYAKRHYGSHFMFGTPGLFSQHNWRFDLVVLSHVLEHIERPVEYLKQLLCL